MRGPRADPGFFQSPLDAGGFKWALNRLIWNAFHNISNRCMYMFGFSSPQGRPEAVLGAGSATAPTARQRILNAWSVKSKWTYLWNENVHQKKQTSKNSQRSQIPLETILFILTISKTAKFTDLPPPQLHIHSLALGTALSVSCILKNVEHLLVLLLRISCQSSKLVKCVLESLWRNVNSTCLFWFECNQTWLWLSLHNKGETVIR